MQEFIKKLSISKELQDVLESAPSIVVPRSREHLLELAMGGKKDIFDVSYETGESGVIREATVTKVKNGLVVNYDDIYMRRRDPDCMLIADDGDTDKKRYEESFGVGFEGLRRETLDWLKKQDLIVMPFKAGAADETGYEAILIAPANAGFFAGGLADLQFFIPLDEVRDGYEPKAVFYLAPTVQAHPFHRQADGRAQQDKRSLRAVLIQPVSRAKCEKGRLRYFAAYGRVRGMDNTAWFDSQNHYTVRQPDQHYA